MLARKYYSQKQLQNKSRENMHDMLHEKGDNWNDLPTYLKRGRCIIKKEERVVINNDYFQGGILRKNWTVDVDIPIFKDNRDYILNILEE